MNYLIEIVLVLAVLLVPVLAYGVGWLVTQLFLYLMAFGCIIYLFIAYWPKHKANGTHTNTNRAS